MERLQIMLLVFISSSWFLTCDTENIKGNNKKKTDLITPFTTDSVGVDSTDSNTDFYSEWLSLPFSGSGSNWMATINTSGFAELILDNYALSVYMKKSGEVYKLNYKSDEGNIEHAIDHGLVTISAGFNPENIEFMYVISPDGTFVKQNTIDINYTAKVK